MSDLTEIPLGKTTAYPSHYDASLLYPVPRRLKRDELGICEPLPFHGEDVWNGYELSWLNSKGKPVVALAIFRFSCQSPNLVESKSFKLYLNSLNQTCFATEQAVIECLQRDLSEASGGPVTVQLSSLDDLALWQVQTLPGECLDSIDLDVKHYQLNADLLRDATDPAEQVEETLYSHLLKSNCLITSQPDWASVWISYRGARLDRQALLAYLISFRQHNEFHEQCVERIFTDLMRHCQPQSLTVYARYTRRGGLDINPWRSTEPGTAPQWRLSRQ